MRECHEDLESGLRTARTRTASSAVRVRVRARGGGLHSAARNKENGDIFPAASDHVNSFRCLMAAHDMLKRPARTFSSALKLLLLLLYISYYKN